MSEIDEIDRQILEAIQDEPMWKSKIRREIDADRSNTSISRRVDNLVEEDCLQQCIIAPEGIAPELIIAFKLTEKGRETIQENTGGAA